MKFSTSVLRFRSLSNKTTGGHSVIAESDNNMGIMGRGHSSSSSDDIALSTPLEAGRPVSEEEEFEYKKVVWKDFVTKKKYIPWWILAIVVNVLVILMLVHHDQIVNSLRPISNTIRSKSWGFIIPILILIAISFPPLFGHEIIALLCGVVYGLWIGFAIVAAGTFLGEIGTWFAFKSVFRKRAIKLERTNLMYGALARMTRDGGFWIVFLIRFSVIPSHFSTAVFSTCGVNFWYFAIATFFTLPKQLVLVYVGVLFAETNKKDSPINDVVIGITFVITVFAGVIIYRQMTRTQKILLEEQKQRKEMRAAAMSQKLAEEEIARRAAGEQEMGRRMNDDPIMGVAVSTNHLPYDARDITEQDMPIYYPATEQHPPPQQGFHFV